MAHPSPPTGRRPAIDTRTRLMLTILLVGAALLTAGNMCAPPSAITLTNGPASAIKLNIQIVPNHEKVQIQVTITDTSGHIVNLRNGQRLTCNDIQFPQGRQGLFGSGSAPDQTTIQVSPQPPGGAYTFVYTDEHGQQTKLVVPVGSTPLRILSPPAAAFLPIPVSKAGLVGTPAITPTPGPRAPDLVASLVVQYTLPEPPAGATINSYVEAGWVIPSCADPQKRYTFPCEDRSVTGSIRAGTSDSNATGVAQTKTVTISDGGPYTPIGYGFETFQPGPGWIHLDTKIHWSPTTTGFSAVDVQMEGATENPITWVRP